MHQGARLAAPAPAPPNEARPPAAAPMPRPLGTRPPPPLSLPPLTAPA
jgi:hypothetical protein